MFRHLLSPPIAFLILFVFFLFFAQMLKKLSLKVERKTDEGNKPYACGEDKYNNLLNPDYSTFFHFAFFFTLAHVATLIMTTVPKEDLGRTIYLAFIYLAAVIVGLLILIRKQSD